METRTDLLTRLRNIPDSQLIFEDMDNPDIECCALNFLLSNIEDLIADKQADEKVLDINSYHWETDPGHGWLVVPSHHLTAMKVQEKISSYSYISTDGKTAYLEEDCDAGRFLESFDSREEVQKAAKNWKDNYQENTFVRSLPSYSSDKIKL